MKKSIAFLFVLYVCIISTNTYAQYTYQKPVVKESIDIDHQSGFEIGFHYGPAWTSGNVREFAKSGGAFSLDLGVNSGTFYFGTEFTITSWRDYYDSSEASELNFEDTNFLWLVHAKVFLGEGKVRPYFGLGTDLISLALGVIEPEDDDDCYYSSCYYEEENRNYNAWIVPSFGVRWEMGPNLSGNIGFSANFSENYDFIRLQLGIVF